MTDDLRPLRPLHFAFIICAVLLAWCLAAILAITAASHTIITHEREQLGKRHALMHPSAPPSMDSIFAPVVDYDPCAYVGGCRG